MNRLNTPQEAIEVLQGIEDGKEIQCISATSNEGFGLLRRDGLPNFSSYFYRVKPEPREWDARHCVVHNNLCSCCTPCDNAVTIKVREVLD